MSTQSDQFTLRQARLRELRALFAANPADVPLLFERACLLFETGCNDEAREAYLNVLSKDPTHRLALNNLGSLLHRTGYRKAAQTAYAEAVVRHPEDPVSHVNLANVLRESGDVAGARAHYETALRLQPDHPDAHLGLSCIVPDPHHRKMAFGNRPIIELLYRGKGSPVPVLLLAGASGGNIPIRHLLDDTLFQTFIVFVEFLTPSTPLPAHRLVFNAIGDADLEGPALAAAESLLARTTARVINLPSAVSVTGRSDNAKRLADIPGVITPGTVTVQRDKIAGFAFPLLVRSPGFHTGRYFLKVETREDLPAALATLPGDELTVMLCLDARWPDGKVRKYRVMMIDGQLYPLHVAISHDWKVHYFTADMADNPAHRAEDRKFLESMPEVLGPKAIQALAEIERRLGLDYAGIDFGLNPDGEILLFEANATMVVNPPEPDEKWAYRLPAVERIFTAVRRLLGHASTGALVG